MRNKEITQIRSPPSPENQKIRKKKTQTNDNGIAEI